MVLTRKQLPLGTRGFLNLVLVFTFLHWYLLFAKIPLFHGMGGWFWKFISKPISEPWIASILSLTPLLSYFLWRSRCSESLKLLCILLIGISHQFGFALLEGKGIDGLRDRLVHTGHAEFVDIAAKYQNDALMVARNYEQLVKQGQLGTYANSKPPGQLLLYIATSRVISTAPTSPTEKVEALRTFASIIWPILSYMTIIPMYILARELVGKATAILSCLGACRT